MTSTLTPYQSPKQAGRDGFPQLLRAEWTKLRTVRAWVFAMIVAALVTVLLGVLVAAGSTFSCDGPGCDRGTPPIGPDGEVVNDSFYFVHQRLSGDGSITVRIGSLTGLRPLSGRSPAGDTGSDDVPGTPEPWAKAGILVKQNTTQGSPYAAVLLSGGNGVRMQDNYLHDTAGPNRASAPRWLRLTRSGDLLTGSESPDGVSWTEVGSVRLAGLPADVPAGLFVASPPHENATQQFGGASASGGPTRAIATFDQVSGTLTGGWKGEHIGASGGVPGPPLGFTESGGTFTVTGGGDIAPAKAEGNSMERSLIGGFAGLIVVVVLGVLVMTGEYRRGMIRTTFIASPRRGRVLAAKALVLGAATFVIGLVASTVAVLVVGPLRTSKGETIMHVTFPTELRVVVGTAALLAVAAVFALAVGALLRRSAGAVTAVIGLVVLPYILATASVLPVGAGQWLLRVTPAAAFAIQQSVPEYSQVAGAYWPSTGYFPLSPWGGFAVLCAWTALALGAAVVLVRRRDA
jgi:ABC-type transport system involved in multi-copper enzyme maturation permease subunit